VEFPEPVKQAINNNMLWRAKEILEGRIGSMSYDPTLYEQYGVILMKTEDLMMAGKYLLLSGSRLPEYNHCIEIFLKRHGRSGWQNMVRLFPAKAKELALSQFPDSVQKDILALGCTAEQYDRFITKRIYPPTKMARLRERLMMIGCASLLILTAIIFIFGIPNFIRAISSIFK